nr:trypsin-like peptidase domain-containing protein [uncultured Pseudogulbenkiania sp.]
MVMGSGFFINSNNPTVAVVMTAAHVLKDFERYDHGWITVGTTMIKIGSIGVQRFDEKRDFAIWEIPSDYLIEQGLENIVTFPIIDQETQMQVFEPTCSFAIFGYPSSKNNTIDSRDQHKSERKIIGIALHGYGFDSELLELGFFYSGKSTPESWSNHITTPPTLDGMSGSPCVRFVVHKKLKRPMLIVAGIFTSLLGKKELRAVALKSPWLPESSFRAHS